MKIVKTFVVINILLNFFIAGCYAQTAVSISVGAKPQQTFREFGWSASPTNNAYMSGKLTSGIKDQFGKTLFEDMNTELVRLWFGFNMTNFYTAYIKSGLIQEARKHGAGTLLFAPAGSFPDSLKCGGHYLCNVQGYARLLADDIKELQDKYGVRIDATGIMNEPGAGGRDNILKKDYAVLVKTLRSDLDKNGLQNVKIIALEHWSPTDTSSMSFAQSIAADPDASKALAGFSTHSYGFGTDLQHAQIALENGWEYWVTEAGGAMSGSDIAARFLNDLNNAATHWVFFLGPSTSISEHTLAAPINGAVQKAFHYYTLQQISKRFLPGTQMRHVTSSVNGDMIYKSTGFPNMNASAGLRPDGRWVIGIANISDTLHDRTPEDFNVTIHIPELADENYLNFAVCHTMDNTGIIEQSAGEITFFKGQGNVVVNSGETVTLVATRATSPVRETGSSRASAIIWPDIPDTLRNHQGWAGNTIPGFTPEKTNYIITLPSGSVKIPAIKLIPQDINASVEVKQAVSISGNEDERTTVFTVLAGDSSSVLKYKIQFETILDTSVIQSFTSEPIISQVSMRIFQATSFVEVANIGNKPLDLSHYMLIDAAGKTPAEAIRQFSDTSRNSFDNRYSKYVPGYKFANDLDTWQSVPARLVNDSLTSPVVIGGDVFVVGSHPVENSGNWYTQHFPLWDEEDIGLSTGINPWGATVSGSLNWFSDWNEWNHAGFLFKILNDSVRNGTKGIYDPKDFKLIDNYGDWDDSIWHFAGIEPEIISGMPRFYNITRKETITEGNTENGTSMGTNAENSEWYVRRMGDQPANANDNTSLSMWIGEGIGNHTLNPFTSYKSVISSETYIISGGYEGLQSIYGVDVNKTVAEFLSNIIMADSGQNLEVHSIIDGAVKPLGDIIADKDTLIVTSADSLNTTEYLIYVAAGGLNSNAVLTSSVYGITIDTANSTGTISGMNFGEAISNVVNQISVPATARMDIVNQKGSLVPLLTLNYDDQYVSTSVSDSVFLKVTAQNGITIIYYRLSPVTSSSDAYVISDAYLVDQTQHVIRYIPSGTTIPAFFRNVFVAPGATAIVTDTLGLPQQTNTISSTLMLKVESFDGVNTNYYDLILKENETRILSDSYIVNNEPEGLRSIDGMDTATSTKDFLSRIVKMDPGQTLEIHRFSDGLTETSNDIVAQNDTLIVISVDHINYGRYLVKIIPGGPDSNAVLTSDIYTITIDGPNSTGTISGMDPGIPIAQILSGIHVPNTARLYITDQFGQPVPLYVSVINADSLETLVRDSLKFRVEAQDGKTVISYALKPVSAADDAWVISDIYDVSQAQRTISKIPFDTHILVFLNNVVPASGAGTEVTDENNNLQTGGSITTGYKLAVTSRDNSKTVTYKLIIMGGEAYVTSDSFTIDQEQLIISGIEDSMDVNEFKNLLTLAPGATIKIIDRGTRTKNSGPLAEGDFLMVISANGNNVVMYNLSFILDVTSVRNLSHSIKIYPNPTNGRFFIKGVDELCHIKVTDILGNILMEKNMAEDQVSIEKLPSGLYFISISDGSGSIIYNSKIIKY